MANYRRPESGERKTHEGKPLTEKASCISITRKTPVNCTGTKKPVAILSLVTQDNSQDVKSKQAPSGPCVPKKNQKRTHGFFKLGTMNANDYIFNELRILDNASHHALNQIRCSKRIRDVVSAMCIPVPTVLRGIKRTCPAFARIEADAHRKAESIVRAHLTELTETATEEDFIRQRALYVREWHLLNGRFPKLASLVQVESRRHLARLRTQQSASKPLPNVLSGLSIGI